MLLPLVTFVFLASAAAVAEDDGGAHAVSDASVDVALHNPGGAVAGEGAALTPEALHPGLGRSLEEKQNAVVSPDEALSTAEDDTAASEPAAPRLEEPADGVADEGDVSPPDGDGGPLDGDGGHLDGDGGPTDEVGSPTDEDEGLTDEDDTETSRHTTKAKGGASSRRALSTLMRKRAQQQRQSSRVNAAQRYQAYYERHGSRNQAGQKEETKLGSKRYKLRNKPPPSLLEERRRRQQQQKEKEEEERQKKVKEEGASQTAQQSSRTQQPGLPGPVRSVSRVGSLRRPAFDPKRRTLRKPQDKPEPAQEVEDERGLSEGEAVQQGQTVEQSATVNEKVLKQEDVIIKQEELTKQEVNKQEETIKHGEVMKQEEAIKHDEMMEQDEATKQEETIKQEETMKNEAINNLSETMKTDDRNDDEPADQDPSSLNDARAEGPVQVAPHKPKIEVEQISAGGVTADDPLPDASLSSSQGLEKLDQDRKPGADDDRKKRFQIRQQQMALRRKQSLEQKQKSKIDQILQESQAAREILEESVHNPEVPEEETAANNEPSEPRPSSLPRRPTLKNPFFRRTSTATAEDAPDAPVDDKVKAAPHSSSSSEAPKPPRRTVILRKGSLATRRKPSDRLKPSRANSKYRKTEVQEKTPTIRINPSLATERRDREGQESPALEELPTTSTSEQLQYLENNPNEKYKFQDSVVGEVTSSYLQESVTEGQILEDGDFDGTTQISSLVSETLTESDSVRSTEETISPVTDTRESFNLEALIVGRTDDENTHDDAITTEVTNFNDDGFTTNVPIHALSTESPTAVEVTETSVENETTKTQTETADVSTKVTTTPASAASSSSPRPFRYSLYNRRPGTRLQEIMERRTAANRQRPSPPTTPADVQVSDLMEQTTLPMMDDQTTPDTTQIFDEEENSTQVFKENQTMNVLGSNDTQAAVIPIDAPTIFSVTTNPIEYYFASHEGEGHESENEHMPHETPLNLADQYERMNLIDRVLNRRIVSDNETSIQDDTIIGAIKNVISASIKSSAESAAPADLTTEGSETLQPFDYNNTEDPLTTFSDYDPSISDNDYYYVSDYYDISNFTHDDHLIHENSSAQGHEGQVITTMDTNEQDESSDVLDIPEGVAILTDGFYYPSPPPTSNSSDSSAIPVKEDVSDKVKQNEDVDTPEDFKISTGFSVKDPISKGSELTLDPTDVEINQVRTDRKSILDSQANSDLEEMTVEAEDPNAPPVTLLIRPNADRIDVGDRDTFDISVSSSLYAQPGDSKSQMTKGQVLSGEVGPPTQRESYYYNEDGNVENGPLLGDTRNEESGYGVGVGQVFPVDLSERADENVAGGSSDVPKETGSFQVSDEPSVLESEVNFSSASESLNSQDTETQNSQDTETQNSQDTETQNSQDTETETTSSPGQSFFGALLNMFTRPERPQPKPSQNTEGQTVLPRRPRPPHFAHHRPDHQYRPFRPGGFRPPPPHHLRPGLQVTENDRREQLQGALAAGPSLQPPGLRPNQDYDNVPHFHHDQINDGINGDEEFENSHSDIRFDVPKGMLPPAPLLPTNSSFENFENAEANEEIIESTLSDEKVLLDKDVEDENATSLNQTFPSAIPSYPEETASDSKVSAAMPQVIAIDGPLEDFINQLGEAEPDPEVVNHNSSHTSFVDLSSTQSPSSITVSPVETELLISSSDYDIYDIYSRNPDNVGPSQETFPVFESKTHAEDKFYDDESLVQDYGDDSPATEPSLGTERSEAIVEMSSFTTSSPVLSENLRDDSGLDFIPENTEIPILETSPLNELTNEESVLAEGVTTADDITSPQTNNNELLYEEDYGTKMHDYYDYEEYAEYPDYLELEAETNNTSSIGGKISPDGLHDQLESVVTPNDVDGSDQNPAVTVGIEAHEPLNQFTEKELPPSHGVEGEDLDSSSVATPAPSDPQVSEVSESNLAEQNAPSLHDIPDGSFVDSHIEEESTDEAGPVGQSRPTIVLPGSRPTLPFSRPSVFREHPARGTKPLSLAERLKEEKYSDPISPPLIETGFQALKPATEEDEISRDENFQDRIISSSEKEQALPPSLPNLQIIPFVAADAVRKEEDDRATEDALQGTALQFGGEPIPGQHQLCWDNGAVLGDGVPVNFTDDPCQSCRCYFGQLICRTQQCQDVPLFCRAVMQPGQCCPLIVCEHELKEEEPIPTDEITDSSYDYSSHSSDHPSHSDDSIGTPAEFPDGTKQNVLDSEIGHIAISEIKPTEAQTVHGSTELKDVISTSSGDTVVPKPLHAVIASPDVRSDETRRPLVPNRYITAANGPASRISPTIDRSDVPPLRRKPAIGGTRPSLPFIHRHRPGGRPTFIPPRRPPFDPSLSSSSSPPTARQASTTVETVTEVSHVEIPRYSTTKLTTQPTSTTTTTTTTSTTIAPVSSDFASFLKNVGGIGSSKSEFLLPRPIKQTSSLESGEIENFLHQYKFSITDTQGPPKTKKTPVKPILPEIPEEVKAQLPLGIDAILASGAIQLSGCNIYGREYVVGENIDELSAPCKACRCTPVGVQCLPIC